jgi:hypothetical protein
MATVHNKADEVHALIYAHTNSAMCMLMGGGDGGAVGDLVQSLEYLRWYRNYCQQDGKPFPEDLAALETRLKRTHEELTGRRGVQEMEVGATHQATGESRNDLKLKTTAHVSTGGPNKRMLKRKKKSATSAS